MRLGLFVFSDLTRIAPPTRDTLPICPQCLASGRFSSRPRSRRNQILSAVQVYLGHAVAFEKGCTRQLSFFALGHAPTRALMGANSEWRVSQESTAGH